MLGVAYEAPTLATGYGAFLAQVSICKQEQCVHSAAEATLVLRDWAVEILVFITFFQPLMREVLEKKPTLTKEEARSLIERCMKILYYRDARSFNRVSVVLRRASGWRSRGHSPQLTAAFAVVLPLILSKPHSNTWVGRDESPITTVAASRGCNLLALWPFLPPSTVNSLNLLTKEKVKHY